MALFRKSEPVNPTREALARHLRIADDYTRKRQYEQAMFEIQKALKLDPKNNNARQFLERVKVQMQKVEDEKKARTSAMELSLEQRMDVIPKLLANAEQLINERQYKSALKVLADVYKIDPTNYYAQAFSDQIDQLMSQEAAQKSQVLRPVAPIVTVVETKEEDESGSRQFYRELLKQYWFDGKLTPAEEKHLAEVRDVFLLTKEDHERLSKRVKFEAYVEALRIAWIDGVITETERQVLHTMRAKYDISQEEDRAAEAIVQQTRKANPSRPVALIVDAEREQVNGVAKGLQAHGYTPMHVGKPEDAFTLLQNTSPQVILSDVKFPGSTVDGFELYRRVRQIEVLRDVPFLFTVRIQDKKVLLAALSVGVDYVIMKPADPEFVLAAIEGKKARSAR